MKITNKKWLLLVTLLMILTLTFGGCKSKTDDNATNTSSETTETTNSAVTTDTTATETTSDAAVEAEADTTKVADTVYPLVLTTKFGATLTIKEEPKTIISLAPELTETIYALNAGDKMIGRSTYCDYPEAVKALPEMGSLFELNIEAIVAKAPDLVVLSSMASEDLVKSLTDQGLNVFLADYDASFEATYDYIALMGMVLNRNTEARTVVADMKTRIEAVQAKVANLEKPSVYYVVGAGEYGDSAATGDTFIGQMLEISGGTNAAADGKNWQYSIEKLVEKNPDILLCTSLYGMKDQLLALEGYKTLSAVTEGRLYEVDENLFSRQGPRVAEGVEVLAKIFHPEAFAQ